MANNKDKDLIPSEDEVKKIISQVMQIDLMQVPAVLLQIALAQLMMKALDRLREDLNQSIKELENQVKR